MANFKIELHDLYMGEGKYLIREPLFVEADGADTDNGALWVWNELKPEDKTWSERKNVAIFAKDEWVSCTKVVE